MLEEINTMLESMIEDPRLLKNIAKMLRALYEELLAQGFTEEQAARIIANYRATGG